MQLLETTIAGRYCVIVRHVSGVATKPAHDRCEWEDYYLHCML
jgi:hypothetical protein